MLATLGTFSASTACGMTRTRIGAARPSLLRILPVRWCSQSPLLMLSRHRAYGDPFVTQGGVAHQHTECIDQGLVTATVHGQRLDLVACCTASR
jgi:hypothetical protein